MKSLEIVNERINELKGVPELECYNKQRIKYLFHNEEGAGLLTYSELETIKQDLEVLEIIIKKEVNIEILKFLLEKYDGVKALEIYNLDNINLTMEELLKLKQWLEENENE